MATRYDPVDDYRRGKTSKVLPAKRQAPLTLGDTGAYEVRGVPRPGPRSQAPAMPLRQTPLRDENKSTAAVPETPTSTGTPAGKPLVEMDLQRDSRAAAVRREMLQRQIIREKQTPFVKRDADGNIDPRVAEAWALNDRKYATDRALALSKPRRIGTAAGAKSVDQAALDELTRQREAEAQGGVPSITNQPSFDKANQYRDTGLGVDALVGAMKENQTNRDTAYAAKDAKIADLDRRIAEYKQKLSQPYAEPVPSETARMDQLARRDAYAAEAGRAGETIASSAAHREALTKEMRDAQIRQAKQIGQPPVGDRLARAQEDQNVRQIAFDQKVKAFNDALLNKGTTPEGVAQLGGQALDDVSSAISGWRDGVVSGASLVGGAGDALRQARVFRDQVLNSLQAAAQANPELTSATARVFKNKLDDMLGTSSAFSTGAAGVTEAINGLLTIPVFGAGAGISAAQRDEREQLAETLNEIYQKISELSGQ